MSLRRDARLLARLLPHVRPHAKPLAIGGLAMPLSIAARMAQPYLLMVAIDQHIAAGRIEGLSTVAGLYLLAVVAQAIAGYVQIHAMATAGQRFVRDLRVALFRRVLDRDAAFFGRTPAGRLMARIVDDTENLSRVFSVDVVHLLMDGLSVLGIVAIMLALDVELTGLTLLTLPVVLLLTRGTSRLVRDASRTVQTHVGQMNAHAQEHLAARHLVRAFGREPRAQDAYDRHSRAHRAANLRSIRAGALLFGGVEALATVAVAMVVFYAAGVTGEAAPSIGVVVAFVEYVRRLFDPLQEASTRITTVQSALASAEHILALHDGEASTAAPPRARPRLVPDRSHAGSHTVDLRGVEFSYREDEPVLRGVDLHVDRGEHVAMVGASGSGKSTIVKLLVRLHTEQAGTLRFEGRDVADWSPRRLRERIAVVTQDAFLFSGTVADNVRVGRPSATDAQVADALAAVGADRLLARRGRGPQTVVDERGTNFSAGERQLIVFARALVRDPVLLVLDEATAQVDPRTEAAVEAGLAAVMEGRSTLVVAHRLSTVRRADRIVVLHQGVVAESGRHEQLLARGGRYAELEQAFRRTTTRKTGTDA